MMEQNNPIATISAATPDDMQMLLDLQARVLLALPPDQHYYIVRKKAAQLQQYLSVPEDTVYRLTLADKHVGQMVLRQDVEGFEAERQQAALGRYYDGGTLPAYGLIQGALVDPACRGLHLLQRLLDHVKEQHDCLLLARIVPANLPSWISFMHAGFEIAAAARDPDDERQVFYMAHRLPAFMPTETQLVDWQDFDACRTLTQEGWRGTAYDRTADRIIFQR